MSDDQLREIVGKYLDSDRADKFVETVLRSAFTDSAGNVDEEKVVGNLTAIFAAGQPQQPSEPPGSGGRDALRKRWGVGDPETAPTAATRIPRARSARSELTKRYKRYGGGKR